MGGAARRQQAEDDGRHGRQHDGIGHDAVVDRQVELERERQLRDERVDRAGEPAGQYDARRAAERGQHEALGHQLPHQAPAPGAERQAHGDLAPPRCTAAQEQAGDVRTPDEQHEAGNDPHEDDEGEHRKHRAGHAAERVETVDAVHLHRGEVLRHFRMCGTNLTCGDRQRRGRLCGGDPGT